MFYLVKNHGRVIAKIAAQNLDAATLLTLNAKGYTLHGTYEGYSHV